MKRVIGKELGKAWLKPAAREGYRLSKSYSCLLAQPIAHWVRVDFTEFDASCNFAYQSCLILDKTFHNAQN